MVRYALGEEFGSHVTAYYVGLVYLIVFCPYIIVGAILTLRRKHLHPIKGRDPGLVLCINFVFVVHAIFICMRRIIGPYDYPCMLVPWVSYIGFITNGNLYTIRCIVLLFRFSFTHEKLRRAKQITESASTPKAHTQTEHLNPIFWYQKHRYLISPWFLGLCFVGVTLTLLVAPLYFLHINPSVCLPWVNGSPQPHHPMGILILAVYIIGYIIILVSFALKLRKVSEGFLLKKELKATAILVSIALTLFMATVMVPQLRLVNDKYFPIGDIMSLLWFIAGSTVSTYWLVYRTYVNPPLIGIEHSADVQITTLETLVNDRDGFIAFNKFLTKEFSVENLLFFQSVRLFKYNVRKHKAAVDLLGKYQELARESIRNAPADWVPPTDWTRKQRRKSITKAKSYQQKPVDAEEKRSLLGDVDDGNGTNARAYKQALIEFRRFVFAQALVLYDTFIGRSAPLAISIPGAIDLALHSKFKAQSTRKPTEPNVPSISLTVSVVPSTMPVTQKSKWTHTKMTSIAPPIVDILVFDNAQASVFELMEMDSYVRFKRTPEYRALVQSLAEKKKHQELHETMNLI